ncbi:MAG: RHS repeat protein [Bacteroidales bacterium]|jgi:YD repeat-containing protein|nr:RHS repeat protein [Bacteroidales bacterium]
MKRILFFVWIIYPMGISGQGMPEPLYSLPVQSTPEVASLIKYAEYPVNHYNGLVDITIPLYEMVCGDLRIPISLSYHASGIKVKEESGRTGLGWTLHAGPALGREIKGRPDDANNGYVNLATGSGNSQFHCSAPDCFFYYRATVSRTSSSDFPVTGWGAPYDLAPDKFYYRLLNQSGAFYFQRDMQAASPGAATIVPHPYEPVDITCSKPSSAIQSFTVKDDQGITYHFGRTGDGTKHAYDYRILYLFGSGQEQSYTSWNIMEIISPVSRHTVKFNYYSGIKSDRVLAAEKSEYVVTEERMLENRNLSVPANGFHIPVVTSMNSPTCEIYRKDISIAGSGGFYNGGAWLRSTVFPSIPYGTEPYCEMYESPLQTIETDHETVEFEGKETLNRILIRDRRSNAIIRSIILSTSNFNLLLPSGQYTGFWEGPARKKLDRIQILDSKGKAVETYTFDYYGEGSVASRYSHDVDHWGYYNARNNPVIKNSSTYFEEPSRVPRHKITVTENFSLDGKPVGVELWIGNSNREPDTAAMKQGALKSITYPAGRKTVFTYQAHRYKRSNGTVAHAGGLRIARIRETEPNGAELTTIYKYGRGESGLGIIQRDVTLDDYLSERNYISGGGIGSAPNETLARTYHADPVGQTVHSSGSSVVYDCVTEYRHATSGSIKTTYEYEAPNVDQNLPSRFITNNPSTYYSGLHSNIAIEKDDMWRFGNLVKKSEYKLTGPGSYTLARETSLGYSQYRDNAIRGTHVFSRTGSRAGIRVIEEIEALSCVPYTYSILTGSKKLVSETVHTVSGGSPVEEKRLYAYGNPAHMLPTQITEYTGRGTTERITCVYPQDTVFTGERAFEEARKKLVEDHRIGTMLGREHTRGTERWTSLNKYRLIDRKPMPASILSGRNRQLEERIQILAYDAYGNPIYTKSDDVKSLYQWGYSGQFLTARVENVTNEPTQDVHFVERTLTQTQNGSFQIEHGGGTVFTLLAAANLDAYVSLELSFINEESGAAVATRLYASPNENFFILDAQLQLPEGKYTVRYFYYTGSQKTYQFNLYYLDKNRNYPYWYNGFEEGTSQQTAYTPFAGSNYHTGNYAVPFSKPAGRKYLIDYRSYNAATGKWEFKSREYTGYMTLNGTAIDEVRVYPADALMTTHTYKPLVGMTSETDPSGRTVFYEYDDFGRLKCVKDEEGKIIKEHRYHYAQ